MAALASDTGALRLRLEIVQREAPVRGPAPVATEDGRTPSGRLLVGAGVEYLDRRDGEWWPLVRLPVLWIAPAPLSGLVGALADLAQGIAPGFAWQSGDAADLALQIGAAEGAGAGALLAEVGLDLSGFLSDTAGVPRRPGAELSLFRFPVTRAAVVAFAGALRAEVDARLAT